MKKILIGIIVLIVIIAGVIGFTLFDFDSSDDAYLEVESGTVVMEDDGSEGEEGDVIIYAEVVESAEECTSLERFDAETSECYFSCDDEEACENVMRQIDAELDGIALDYTEFSKTFKEFSGDTEGLNEKAKVIYTIEEGEVFTVTQGEEGDTEKKIKKWLAAISPDIFSDAYLNRVVLYNDPDGDTAAYVERLDESEKWDMYVNLDTLADGEKEMVFTLIHEFAHIFTLNASQVDSEIEEDFCVTYYVQEGCFKPDAYLAKFFTTFWFEKYGKGVSQFDLERVNAYKGNAEDFVSEYAATNPGEDIAETFAQFVLAQKSTDTTLAGQKINFFHDFKELRFIRDDIRKTLAPFAHARLR